MIILVNGKNATIEEGTTVAQLLEQRHIPTTGTAIAVNGRLIKGEDQATKELKEMDNVMIISAAYGG